MNNLIDRLESRQLLASAGTPDVSFGANARATGSVVVAPAPAYDESKLRAAIDNRNNPPLVLNDGRVLAFLPRASTYPANDVGGANIVRFLSDGRLDTSWGDRGFFKVSDARGSGSAADAVDMRVDAQGRLYAAHFDYTSSAYRLLRLTTAGRLDTTFSGDGILELPDFTGFVGVDSRSRPVIASISSENTGFDLLRFTATGTPDATFDGDGRVWMGGTGSVRAATVDASDRIVYAFDETDAVRISRRLVNGSPDPSFGTQGTATFGVAPAALWYNASASLFARSDGGYTFVAAGLVDDPFVSLWQINANGASPRGQVDVAVSANLGLRNVQFGFARDESISVTLTPEPGDPNSAHLIRIAASGAELVDVPLAVSPDISGLNRLTGPTGFRRDGSPVAISLIVDPPVPNPWGQDRNGRVTGLVAWRVGGGIDGGVKQLPRMRVTDVFTVRSDGQPVFGFADVAGNFAGRGDRQADGSYRARLGTLAGTYAANWSVAYGRVFANYKSFDYSDGDGIALNATVLEQNGTKKTFGSEDSTWDGSFALLPRGYATSKFQSDFGGGNVTNLYAPSGRVVQRAAEQSRAVFFTLVPQRTTDNAFATPIDNYSGEDGDIGNFPAGIMLRSPSGARLTSWGTRGANQGGATPWFADSRGRLLAFTADKKSIVRYTSRGAIDSTFRAVFTQGWNLDIDSRDRIVAWRVLQNAGTATGDVQVRRFNADGSADATFGTNGLAIVDSGLAANAGGQAYVDSADNVVVVSIERTGSQVKWSATKLRAAATAPAFAASVALVTDERRSSESASVLN